MWLILGICQPYILVMLTTAMVRKKAFGEKNKKIRIQMAIGLVHTSPNYVFYLVQLDLGIMGPSFGVWEKKKKSSFDLGVLTNQLQKLCRSTILTTLPYLQFSIIRSKTGVRVQEFRTYFLLTIYGYLCTAAAAAAAPYITPYSFGTPTPALLSNQSSIKLNE